MPNLTLNPPRLITLLLALALLIACTPRVDVPVPTAEVDAPLLAESRVHGTLTAWPNPAAVSGRGIALCLLQTESTLTCEVQPDITTTDAQGTFQFTGIPGGKYLVLLDPGRADFAGAVANWSGKSIHPGDWPWLAENFLGLPNPDFTTTVNLYMGVPIASDRLGQYATETLMLDGSPFVIAHTLNDARTAADLVILDVTPAVTDFESPPSTSVSILTVVPHLHDPAATRDPAAALSRDETRILDPALVARQSAYLSGDDSAYSDGDAALIAAVRSGILYQIGDAYLTRVDIFEGALIKGIGYMVFDHQTGAPTLIGLIDPATSDVREISTGYMLNVRDNPGEGLVAGPNGEQFYHYGWSYYQVWRRILPDPFVAIAERFRTVGAANVTRYLDAYRESADAYPDGDLTLLPWDASTAQAAMDWSPRADAPPYLSVPDSGTVDVRRERFYEAVTSGVVFVDEASVVRFLQGDVARNGFFYTPDVTAQTVIDALLAPYRAGHLYTDFEAAMILDATYGGEGPLVIRVTGQMPDGAFVPRDEKQLFFADGEVADVILGYSGTLTARWPHEMGHILDFRDPRNDYPRVRRGGSSRCEPFKYMMEYMWWVERFPYDAPDWDWQPVGSGLTLARLLTGTYPNSGC